MRPPERATERRVLVVEDDPATRALERDIFSVEGWEVALTGGVAEGLEAARASRFDVVVCDLTLPDGDGLQLVAALRNQPGLSSIPIIVVTGRTGGDNVSKALDAGANDYVVKPFDSRELVARCRSAIKAHESWVELALSERQLRQLADSAADLIVVVQPNGLIRYASPSASNMIGWDPSELMGRPAADLFDPPPHPEGGAALRERMRVRRSFGEPLWIDAVVRSMSPEGELVVWGRDITDQVAADVRLSALSRARHAILSETGDSRFAISAAARRVTDALVVALLEPVNEKWLSVTASSGVDLTKVSVSLDAAALAARSYRGCDVQVAGAEVRTRPDDPLWNALPPELHEQLAGAIYLPVVGPRGPLAVMAVALSGAGDGFNREMLDILQLLVSDAAVAIEREDTSRQLAEEANRDPLTGLANRRYLERAVTRALSSSAPVSFALLDLDHFKVFNDTKGHQVGDRVLIDAARAWTRLIRAEDTLARFGGDEFAVLLINCQLDVAASRLDRLRAALPIGVAASAGVTEAVAGDSLVSLVGRADEALYRAKAKGRDCTERG